MVNAETNTTYVYNETQPEENQLRDLINEGKEPFEYKGNGEYGKHAESIILFSPENYTNKQLKK
jgi:hypothetical protein